MTTKEALALMALGLKVRRTTWGNRAYIHLVDGEYIDENGTLFQNSAAEILCMYSKHKVQWRLFNE